MQTRAHSRFLTDWTNERLAMLRTLYGNGLSFSGIAKEINRETGGAVTRNACIGKVRRLNLPFRTRAFQPHDVDRAAIRRRTVRRMRGLVPGDGNRIEPTPIKEPPKPADFLSLTFDQLDNGFKQCRYPAGGDGEPVNFCGQPPQDGASYCQHHYRLCYTRPQAPERQRAA